MADGFVIRAEWNAREVRTLLTRLAPKQWAFATSLALNLTAREVKAAEVAEMRRVFDRPRRFTLNSLQLHASTKRNHEARVWFKDPNIREGKHYLDAEVHGGVRRDTRFERALQRKGFLRRGRHLVPAGGAERDASTGNVRAGLQARILSQLHAQYDPAQNETAKSKRRNRRAREGRFFYGNPHGFGYGVWERVRGGRVLGGRMKSSIRPVFLETRPNRYRIRFPFFAVADRTMRQAFAPAFVKAIERTAATAR